MAKYITLGKFNKNYFFLLGAVVVRLVKVFINGFKPSLQEEKKEEKRIYLFNHKPFFSSHPLFREFLQYFSYALIGFILEMIYYRNNNNKITDDKSDKLDERQDSFNYSINYDFNNNITENRISDVNDKKNFGKIFWVIFLSFLSKFVSDSLNNIGFISIKFWPLQYIFLIIFSKKILHKNLYKHQKASLITLIIFCTSITIIISFMPISIKKDLEEDSNIYNVILKIHNASAIWLLIPIIIIVYVVTMVMSSYSIVRFKWLIDIQYITITRIIMYIGILGFLISFPLFFVFSHTSCGKSNEPEEELKNICPFNVSNLLYYENYRNLTSVEKDANFYIDIFIALILYLATSFLNIFFNFMIIKNLDPFYLIPIDSIYYSIIEIIDYCITRGGINDNRHKVNTKFALKLVNNFASVILSLIYFEIIELHFCGLDQHLRKYILKREDLDKKFLIFNVNEDDDDEDNDDNQ